MPKYIIAILYLLVGCTTPTNIVDTTIKNTITVNPTTVIVETKNIPCRSTVTNLPKRPILPIVNNKLTAEEIDLILLNHIEELDRYIDALQLKIQD